ncbi:MAG: secretin N-terminal domain-containing protein [Marinobacterium sp.]|nr:secretin N-terminal domain-containing protein [Marinobacterium sp.]
MSVSFVAGCMSVQGDKLAPIAQRESINGHLTPSVPALADTQEIPGTVDNQVYLPEPDVAPSLDLFTVSAADIPVAELLYSLARDAELQLDVYNGVAGRVTINAIDQTLPSILKRIADQASLVFELNDNHLIVRPDRPVWRTYEIDYLNVERSVDSQVVLNMSVSAGPGESNSASNGSQTAVSTKSESLFWQNLSANILALVTSAKMERAQGELERQAASVLSSQKAALAEAAAAAQQGDPLVSTSTSTSTSTSADPASSMEPSTATLTVDASNDVVISREAGVVSVFTDHRAHAQLQAYLDRVMHRVRKEVLIEATIVEVELSDDFRTGVDWAALSDSGRFRIQQSTIGQNFADISNTSLGSGTAPENIASGRNQTFGILGGDLAVNLQMVQRYGDTRVLSSPKIMAVNNQTALLKVVDNYVYFGLSWEREEDDNGNLESITYTSELHTVPVGLIMSVTPFISSNDEVTLSVRPTISRIVGFVQDPAVRLAAASLANPEDVKSEVPLIREREMEAVLKVRNGQTAVIGGLMQDSDDKKRDGLPGLESVPGVGNAFAYQGKQRRKSELVIFIRPIIVEQPDVESGDLKGFRPYLPGQKVQSSTQGAF